MPVYTAKVDTDNKVLEVTCNGEVVNDVRSVNFARYVEWDGDEEYCAFVYCETKDAGVFKTLQLRSEETPNFDAAIKAANGYFNRG